MAMKELKNTYVVVPEGCKGVFLLPAEAAEVRLNPTERTLFLLFLAHPEGIASCNLLKHWKELSDIYSVQSRFDDAHMQDDALESLCSESKRTFYTNISRIKRKFVAVLGRSNASKYIIKRYKNGLYKTKAKCVNTI